MPVPRGAARAAAARFQQAAVQTGARQLQGGARRRAGCAQTSRLPQHGAACHGPRLQRPDQTPLASVSAPSAMDSLPLPHPASRAPAFAPQEQGQPVQPHRAAQGGGREQQGGDSFLPGQARGVCVQGQDGEEGQQVPRHLGQGERARGAAGGGGGLCLKWSLCWLASWLEAGRTPFLRR